MYNKIYNRPEYRDLRRSLRKSMTNAEQILWGVIRRDQLGVRLRRQHGIGRFIADFYSREAGLVIEVDGPIHDSQDVKSKDSEKEMFIASLGLYVLRFTNEEVECSLNDVISRIQSYIKKPLSE